MVFERKAVIINDLQENDTKIARKTFLNAKEKMKEDNKNMRGITLDIMPIILSGQKIGNYYKFHLTSN